MNGQVVLPGGRMARLNIGTKGGRIHTLSSGATRAAIKGSLTTVVDMPLDNPPPLTSDALREKIAGISGSCHLDYALFGRTSPDGPRLR